MISLKQEVKIPLSSSTERQVEVNVVFPVWISPVKYKTVGTNRLLDIDHMLIRFRIRLNSIRSRKKFMSKLLLHLISIPSKTLSKSSVCCNSRSKPFTNNNVRTDETAHRRKPDNSRRCINLGKLGTGLNINTREILSGLLLGILLVRNSRIRLGNVHSLNIVLSLIKDGLSLNGGLARKNRGRNNAHTSADKKNLGKMLLSLHGSTPCNPN